MISPVFLRRRQEIVLVTCINSKQHSTEENPSRLVWLTDIFHRRKSVENVEYLVQLLSPISTRSKYEFEIEYEYDLLNFKSVTSPELSLLPVVYHQIRRPKKQRLV